MTLDTDQIQQIITPHAQRLSRAVWPTWDRFFKQIPASERAPFDSATEANVLHCLMADGIRREFVDVPGATFLEKYRFCLGLDGFPRVDGLVVCRFKRLNEVGQSRVYPTERAQQIQGNNSEIDGVPKGATILDVGYVMNELGTGFSDVQVIRVLGVKYVMSIPRAEDGSIQMPSPLFGDGGPTTSRFEIIRPREAETESSQN